MWLLPFHSFFSSTKKKGKVNVYADFEGSEIINLAGFYVGGNLNMNNICDKPTEMVPTATGSLKRSMC